MALFIKANPKVAEYLGLTEARNRMPDGNYMLWQADMLAFAPIPLILETCKQIGALALQPHEARQEQDGEVCRPLPDALDERFRIEQPAEEPTEEQAGEQSGSSELSEEAEASEATDEPTSESVTRGAVLRGPQNWDECADDYLFLSGGDGEIFVDIVIHNNRFYACKTTHRKGAWNDDYWEQLAQPDLVKSEVTLGEGVKPLEIIESGEADTSDKPTEESDVIAVTEPADEEGGESEV